MDLKVCIPWWTPRSVGGSQQAIRGNVRGFLELGADVDLWMTGSWQDLLPLQERASEYDLIVWPFLQQWIETEPDEAHVHATVGGFGPSELDDDTIAGMFERADSISFLDPVLAHHFQERVGLAADAAHLVLNPPNRALFDGDYVDEWVLECSSCGEVGTYDTEASARAAKGGHANGCQGLPIGDPVADVYHRHFTDGGDGHVLVPKIGNEHKTGQALATVASQSADVRYETSIVQAVGTGPINTGPGLPSNVRVRPGVPYTAMPRRYRECSVVFNVAEREAGPNVAYEAFLADRPFVSTPGGIGYFKQLPAVAVDVDGIGTRFDWWFEEHGPYIGAGNGEHYRSAPVEELPQRIRTLLGDEAARADLVAGGRRWLDQLDGYTWESKAQTIVDIMEET